MQRPLKIAILTTDGRGSGTKYISSKPTFGAAVEALLKGFSGYLGVEIHVISCLQNKLSSPEKLDSNIYYHGLHVPKMGWLRTGYQGCIRAVRRKLRELQPDIVHGQGTERDCAISAVLSGCKNVVTIHGNMRLIATQFRARPFSFAWLAARIEAWTLPRTDGVVCISGYTRRAVASLNGKTWLVPNAASTEFFSVDSRPAAPFQLLGIGHIQSRKNWNALILSLDAIVTKYPMKLLLFGELSEELGYVTEFQRLVKERPWVSYGGPIRHEKIPEQLSTASAFVLPSLEDNCPMVVLEAMAAGIPVMAGEVGGVPDLISHGRTGLLFDPRSAVEMQKAAIQLLTDADLRARLSSQSRMEALKRFHPKQVAEQHVNIYREILGKA